jgi:hypothetical protein
MGRQLDIDAAAERVDVDRLAVLRTFVRDARLVRDALKGVPCESQA